MIYDVEILEEFKSEIFKEKLKQLLNEGFELKSSSVGFINSENYNFCSSYQALLVKCDKTLVTSPPKYKIGTKVKLDPHFIADPEGVIVGYQVDSRINPTGLCKYIIETTYEGQKGKFAFEEGDFEEIK